MRVSGDMAKKYQVVDLSSFTTIPGTLVEADDQTGIVRVKDKTGEEKTMQYGLHRIRIVPLHHR